MKKIFILFTFVVLTTICSNINAQEIAPPGAGDRDLNDKNIKNRSIDLERVDRDARKTDQSKSAEKIEQLRFTEIKDDFEKIQMLQNGIIEAYTKGKEIDYTKISTNAGEISKSGTRLKENLFAAPVVEEKKDSKDSKKKDKKKEPEQPTPTAEKTEEKPEQPLPTDVKNLIVELDNTLLTFTGNPMFTNPKVVSAADNVKAKSDLERIIRLSAALKQESNKSVKPLN